MTAGIIGFVVLLYVFLISPSLRRKNFSSFYGWDYAHRGLHDKAKGIPENSLLAFKRATVQGYGIELDVQKTKDDILVVFHDDTLDRLCGVGGKIKDYTYEQLKNFKLFSSSETIPTFEQVLKVVDGKVPLIVEIKTAGTQGSVLAQQVYDVLSTYRGTYCVESFDPRIVRWYKKKAPQVVRGQLAVGKTGEGAGRATTFFIKYLLLNVLSRPDFVAYQYQYDQNLSLWMMRNFFKVPLVAWTVTDPKDYRMVKEKYQLQIFEGFLPNNELTL